MRAVSAVPREQASYSPGQRYSAQGLPIDCAQPVGACASEAIRWNCAADGSDSSSVSICCQCEASITDAAAPEAIHDSNAAV